MSPESAPGAAGGGLLGGAVEPGALAGGVLLLGAAVLPGAIEEAPPLPEDEQLMMMTAKPSAHRVRLARRRGFTCMRFRWRTPCLQEPVEWQRTAPQGLGL